MGRNSQWDPSSISVNFAAKIASPFYKHISAHAKALRVQWNKGFYGDSRSKYIPPTATSTETILLTQCEFCGSPNCDQQHWIVECAYGPFQTLRQTIITSFQTHLASLSRHHQLNVFVSVLERYLSLALRPNGYRFWTGMITRLQTQSFSALIPRVPPSVVSKFLIQLQFFGGLLLQGSVDLWLLRWDTPFPPIFTRALTTPILLNSFKYKLPKPRRKRTHPLRPTSSDVLASHNFSVKQKRNTQTRLGQEVHHPPMNTVQDIRINYSSLPTFFQQPDINPQLRGMVRNQISQVPPSQPPITGWVTVNSSPSQNPQSPLLRLTSTAQSHISSQAPSPISSPLITSYFSASPTLPQTLPQTTPPPHDCRPGPPSTPVCTYTSMQLKRKIKRPRKGEG
jgi:hypothetical protein